VINKDLKEKIIDLIKDLNEHERTIISLYYYEGLNYKEIAHVLNVSTTRVSQTHSRICNILKSESAGYNR